MVQADEPSDGEARVHRHDAFISYSSKDSTVGATVCAILEKRGIRCWMAPRDITPGKEWAQSIVEGISECRVFVLIFSERSNASPQVRREVERAANHERPIIPFRIDNVVAHPSLEFFISSPHWLDALTPPLEAHVNHLADVVEDFLKARAKTADAVETLSNQPSELPPVVSRATSEEETKADRTPAEPEAPQAQMSLQAPQTLGTIQPHPSATSGLGARDVVSVALIMVLSLLDAYFVPTAFLYGPVGFAIIVPLCSWAVSGRFVTPNLGLIVTVALIDGVTIAVGQALGISLGPLVGGIAGLVLTGGKAWIFYRIVNTAMSKLPLKRLDEFTRPYIVVTALLGGAMASMAAAIPLAVTLLVAERAVFAISIIRLLTKGESVAPGQTA